MASANTFGVLLVFQVGVSTAVACGAGKQLFSSPSHKTTPNLFFLHFCILSLLGSARSCVALDLSLDCPNLTNANNSGVLLVFQVGVSTAVFSGAGKQLFSS